MTVNGTSAAAQRPATFAGGRVDWVDYAKGICIVMVVMMHSVLGVEAAADQTGFMHALVAFAKPFRMPVFFVVTKLTRKMPPLAIWTAAAALEMTHVATGWTVIDEFCSRFVYFYSGYWFAASVFALSDRARARPALSVAGLVLWALINGALVEFGYGEWPLVSLALGLAGASAIIVTGTLLARARWLNFLRYCGEHSIVIYLAFFLPMAATRTLLLRSGLIADI